MYDQGEYICVAENSVGRVDAAANIVVVPDPNSRRFGSKKRHNIFQNQNFQGRWEKARLDKAEQLSIKVWFTFLWDVKRLVPLGLLVSQSCILLFKIVPFADNESPLSRQALRSTPSLW